MKTKSLLMITVVMTCFLTQPAHADFGLFGPKVETIDTKTLHEMLVQREQVLEAAEQEGVEPSAPEFVVVDVRSDNETRVSIIPGAITKAQFEEDSDSYQKVLVIPYCTVGGRSGAYAKQLVKQDFKVKNYKGSILKWVGAGLPVETLEGKPTNRVHTFSSRYRIPAKYEQVTQ